MSEQLWTIMDSKKLYKIPQWGAGYYDVNDKGHLVVNPEGKNSPIDIKAVVDEIKEEGLGLPCVIRFHDVLHSQVKLLNETFRNVIDNANYEGRYLGVFPVKVNQMNEVVDEIVRAGKRYDYGLEAGSKSELLAVLAMNTNNSSLTILNGYKDRGYLRLALLGTRIGRKMVVVIEQFSEIMPLIELSREMGVTPMVGLRGKLSVAGSGRWSGSSGERAKFGLTAAEILKAVELFDEHNMKNCLELLHFHIGSQVPDIHSFKEAVGEAGRIYAKLVTKGIALEYIDIGGGLGVDYDGSRSTENSSINYTMKEYVSDVVHTLKQICNAEGVPHPNIVSESGRAVTAHHSCIITNVIGQVHTVTEFNTDRVTGENALVSEMRNLEVTLTESSDLQDIYNNANQIKEKCLSEFKLGVLGLDERAKIETIYWRIVNAIYKRTDLLNHMPSELQTIENNVAPQYLCNFSIFQSAADSWAIGQILPIVPIARLNERPEIRCSLADITCDSDGKINRFIGEDASQGGCETIALHDLKSDEEYHVGIFMTGAYQDVMGDMHNLFGRLNEVHVFKDTEDPSGFYIEEIIRGQSAGQVLSIMQYNPEYMAYKMKMNIDEVVARGQIQPRKGVELTDFYEDSLSGYTYLA